MLGLEAFVRLDHTPIGLDDLTHQAHRLRDVLIVRDAGAGFRRAYEQDGEIEAEVLEQRLRQRELQRRRVLWAKPHELRVGVDLSGLPGNREGGSRAKQLAQREIEEVFSLAYHLRARQRRARGRHGAVRGGAGLEGRIEYAVGTIDLGSRELGPEALDRDAGIVLERCTHCLAQREALDGVVARLQIGSRLGLRLDVLDRPLTTQLLAERRDHDRVGRLAEHARGEPERGDQ